MTRYRIYPTLLDNYQRMRVAEGQEEHDQRERELLDKINRVPSEPSFAASRGTALNNCVDAVVKGNAAFGRLPIQPLGTDFGEVIRGGTPEAPTLLTECDGFTFEFAEGLVQQLADLVGDAVCQPFLSAEIVTCYGDVELYGYADYINGDTIIDLKTTGDYSVGKYRENWQHRVYPLLAVRSGMMESVYGFQYLVAEIKGTKQPFDGKVYHEDYHGALFVSEAELRIFLECDFLPWIEEHRQQITDKKIFNIND